MKSFQFRLEEKQDKIVNEIVYKRKDFKHKAELIREAVDYYLINNYGNLYYEDFNK